MSKIEVINFEEKVRKMKRSSKVNGFFRHDKKCFDTVWMYLSLLGKM